MTASELASDEDQPALVQAAGEMAVQAGRFEEAIGLLDSAAAAYAARVGSERQLWSPIRLLMRSAVGAAG